MYCMPRILSTQIKLTILLKTKCKQVNRNSSVPWILSTHLEEFKYCLPQILSRHKILTILSHKILTILSTHKTLTILSTHKALTCQQGLEYCVPGTRQHTRSLHYTMKHHTLYLHLLPGGSYCRQLGSLLYLCCVFQAQINSLVGLFDGNLFVVRYNFCQHT